MTHNRPANKFNRNRPFFVRHTRVSSSSFECPGQTAATWGGKSPGAHNSERSCFLTTLSLQARVPEGDQLAGGPPGPQLGQGGRALQSGRAHVRPHRAQRARRAAQVPVQQGTGRRLR